MPGRDADERSSLVPESSGPLEGQGPEVRGARNPRAPGTDRPGAAALAIPAFPLPVVDPSWAWAWIAGVAIAWGSALVVGVLAVLRVFPGR